TGSGTVRSAWPTQPSRTVQTGDQVGHQNQCTDCHHDDASGRNEVFLRPAHSPHLPFISRILSVSSSEAQRCLKDVHLAINIDAPAPCKSWTFLRRIVGVVFMRVNSKCAHQVRPPPRASRTVE